MVSHAGRRLLRYTWTERYPSRCACRTDCAGKFSAEVMRPGEAKPRLIRTWLARTKRTASARGFGGRVSAEAGVLRTNPQFPILPFVPDLKPQWPNLIWCPLADRQIGRSGINFFQQCPLAPEAP